MSERSELLEATLDCHPEGIALLGQQCHVVLWNRSAEAITGYLGLDLVGRQASDALGPLLQWCGEPREHELVASPPPGRRCLLHINHQLGHKVPVFVRLMALRDEFGCRIGKAVIFHPAESLDALPRGK